MVHSQTWYTWNLILLYLEKITLILCLSFLPNLKVVAGYKLVRPYRYTYICNDTVISKIQMMLEIINFDIYWSLFKGKNTNNLHESIHETLKKEISKRKFFFDISIKKWLPFHTCVEKRLPNVQEYKKIDIFKVIEFSLNLVMDKMILWLTSH